MSTSAPSTPDQRLAQLASIVGQEHARARGDAVVAAPGEVSQVAEVLRFALANGIAVIPMGGGTKLDWGNPVRAGILLSMERVNTLREHAWQDMTCTVEAGCPWAAMQAELARHGQMVALDPLWPERATVGGIVATNDSGALRLKYGGLRDLIIGMTVVLADGCVAKTGGKVVKNVAGYDLHKLMTGAFGTLGVIAEVNFRLHPVEEHARSWTAIAGEAEAFAEPLRALMDSQMTPSCVQLRNVKDECALDVRIAAVPECLREHEERVREIFTRFEMRESDETVWQARQLFFAMEEAVVLKVSVLPGEMCRFSAELQRVGAAKGISVASVGQATGLITAAFKAEPETATAVIEDLRKAAADCGGSVVALRIPETMRGKVDVWSPEPNALPLMREIKRRFDPGRILNPGRFVGNI